ncbi:MAG: pentapeptide repeat-containing protein [Cyanobacteria bacterium P01_G01_bin.39]
MGILEYIFVILLGIYFGFRALKDDSRFILLRNIALNLPVWGQTNFESAMLTGANFESANLQHTNFSGANLTHCNWYNAKQLNHIKVGKSYLRYPEIRRLVVGKSGENKVFESLDLSGINLTESRLNRASFIKTNLANAKLRGVNLSDTTLLENNFEGAILSEATLTGAYIENCYISRASQLDNIKCDFLYQRQPTIGDYNQIHQLVKTKISFEKFKKKWLRDTLELEFLYNIFDQIYSINNKIVREYQLITKAKKAENLGINSESFRQMFNEYCRKKVEKEWNKSFWKSIFSRIERRIEDLHRLVNEMDIFPILERLSQLSIVFGIFVYANQIYKENRELQYRSWDIITTNEELEELGGRVNVLRNWRTHRAD